MNATGDSETRFRTIERTLAEHTELLAEHSTTLMYHAALHARSDNQFRKMDSALKTLESELASETDVGKFAVPFSRKRDVWLL